MAGTEARQADARTARNVGLVAKAVGTAASALPFGTVVAATLHAANEAYKRVVANRERCRRLLERMELLLPAVRDLEAKGLGAGEAEVLERIKGNFEVARDLITDWALKGVGFFGTLKQSLAAGSFGEDFDRLRDELAARITELHVYQVLAVRADIVLWRKQDAAAQAADRRELPKAIAAEADNDLTGALKDAGLTLEAFKGQLKKHNLEYEEVKKSLEGIQACEELLIFSVNTHLQTNPPLRHSCLFFTR